MKNSATDQEEAVWTLNRTIYTLNYRLGMNGSQEYAWIDNHGVMLSPIFTDIEKAKSFRVTSVRWNQWKVVDPTLLKELRP